MVAGDGGIEGVDLFVEAFGEAGVGVGDNERDLAHHLAGRRRREGRQAHVRARRNSGEGEEIR